MEASHGLTALAWNSKEAPNNCLKMDLNTHFKC